MNRPSVINQTTFHLLYTKYKNYSIPLIVVIVSIFLIVFIILPQFQNWQTSKTEAGLTEEKVQVLTKTLDVIGKTDNQTLNNNIQLTTRALPEDKDFSAIINAITNTAITSSVILDDYTFQVGELGSHDPKIQYLQLLLAIRGNAGDVNRFIQTLETQLPLSDVTNIQINGDDSAQITLVFYYNPFPKLTFDAAQTIDPLTSKEESILKTIQRRINTFTH